VCVLLFLGWSPTFLHCDGWVRQDEDYKDASLIMQLMHDNLILWTTDLPSAPKVLDDRT